MTALAGEGKKILAVTVFALHLGKAIVWVAAIKITIDDLLKIGTEESINPLESFLVNSFFR